MLTLAGALCTVAGALGLGGSLCLERRRRMEELFLLEKFLYLAAGEIAYARTGVSGLLLEAGQRLGGGFGGALQKAGERLEARTGETLDAIWQEEMESYLGTSCLAQEERALLLSFPAEVGFADPLQQRRAIERLGEETGKRARNLRQQLGAWEKMTMALCLSGGIGLAILLW